MSERLENELKKVKYASVYKLDDTNFFVKKDVSIRVLENKCYLVKLNDSIFNANNIINTNWNGGRIPKCRYYQVDVNTIMANMIKVSGIGYNEPECITPLANWWGWLPLEEIEVIKQI